MGQPSLLRYSPADTDAHPYSFSVLALDDGQNFVGNSDAVPRYFGQRWMRGLVEVGTDAHWLLTYRGRLHHVVGTTVEARPHGAEDLLQAVTPCVMVALPGAGYAIGTRSGDILRVDADFSQHSIWPTGPVPVIGLAVDRENNLWAATEADILRVSLSDAWSLIDRYRLMQRFSDRQYRFDEIAEAPDGSLLVDRRLADPMRFALLDDRRLGEPQAVDVSAESGVDRSAAVLEIDGRALIATDSALLAWDGQRFAAVAPDPLIAAGIARSSDLRVRTCADGSLFAFDGRRLLRRDADPAQPFVELRPMDGGTRGVIDVQCGADDGVAWSGMVRFEPRAARTAPLRAGPVMERVRLDADDGSTRWLPLLPGAAELGPFRQIRFEYASPVISSRMRYQSRLDGYDQAWIESGADGYREFSAQRPDECRFEARVLDETGVAGPILEYPLRVPRAWYQTVWIAIAALALIVAMFLWLLRWRSRTLERRNHELEALVSERTEALAQRSHELELVNKRLSELADLDGLTGVANRRKLEHEMDDAWSAARAADAHVALLLIDVDHFSQFNDSYGHALGDQRLKAIAERLAGWVGPGELLARYGGEEFVLLMPGSTIEVAIERAEAMRRDARHAGRDGSRSSISIGVSERLKHKPTSAAQLFEFADLALYRAKNAGRDRVEVYTE